MTGVPAPSHQPFVPDRARLAGFALRAVLGFFPLIPGTALAAEGMWLLDNLPLSFFFGSANTNTLPVVMLSYMENQFDPSIAAISTVQMLIAIVVLLIADRVYGIEKLTS